MRLRQGMVSAASTLAITMMLTACGDSAETGETEAVSEDARVAVETGTLESEPSAITEHEPGDDESGTDAEPPEPAADTHSVIEGDEPKECGEVRIPESYAHQGPPRFAGIVTRGNADCPDALTVSERYFLLAPTDMMGWSCTDNSAIPGGYTPGSGAPVIECANGTGDAFIDMYISDGSTSGSEGGGTSDPEPLGSSAHGDTLCGPANSYPTLNITITGPSNSCANAQALVTALYNAGDRSVYVDEWVCGIAGAGTEFQDGYTIFCDNSADGTEIRLRAS